MCVYNERVGIIPVISNAVDDAAVYPMEKSAKYLQTREVQAQKYSEGC